MNISASAAGSRSASAAARRAGARQVAGVVLDALAEAQLVEHFEVEAGALLDALRLDQLAFSWKNFERSRSSSLIVSIARSTVARGVT
jgi:hypothetical protein